MTESDYYRRPDTSAQDTPSTGGQLVAVLLSTLVSLAVLTCLFVVGWNELGGHAIFGADRLTWAQVYGAAIALAATVRVIANEQN